MVGELLRLAAEGGIHSYQELARRLSISQTMLEMMLEDLARLGYLRAVGGECGEPCTACPVGGCSAAGPGRLWSLTDKGAKAAARLVSDQRRAIQPRRLGRAHQVQDGGHHVQH